MLKHFLRDDDLTPTELIAVLELAARLKADPFSTKPLAGPKTVAIMFDKPTLRTQASFVAGIAELGGFPMVIDSRLAGIGERESIADVARVLGRQASAIVWRTGPQTRIDELAEYAGVPVVNALTDEFHPCQGLADLLTIQEEKQKLAGLKLCFTGDTDCNMANTYLLSGAAAGMEVVLTGPKSYAPNSEILAKAARIAASTGGQVSYQTDPKLAAAGADVMITDTWISMGREAEAAARVAEFTPWQLNQELLNLAKPDAIVLHCLPAYRGKEITAEVLDGPQSRIWDQAENRKHVQKAILAWLVAQ